MKVLDVKWKRGIVSALLLCVASSSPYALTFNHTITGDDLKVEETAEKAGRDTAAVKKFLETGDNLYNGNKLCLPSGEQLYLSSCSGCHGHVAEGKVGPGLNDNYWTYPKNKSDKGLFETIYGGANSMMGPHNDLQLDEILRTMAWIRHLYKDGVEDADWLTPEQKKTFTPFKPDDYHPADGTGADATKASAECLKSVH